MDNPTFATFEGQATEIRKRVFYTGSTDIIRGQGFCYDRDYGTAANADGKRDQFVELPSNTNNRWFAGVAARDYVGQTGGRWIEILVPGSVFPVSALIATVVGSTRLTCIAGGSGIAGRFGPAGLPGRGTVLALQTLAAISSPTDTNPGIVGSSTDGTATVDAAGTTVSDTAAFTNAAVGDKLVVVGGKTTTNGGVAVTPGVYTVTAVTDANTIVVDSAMASAASVIAYYLIRGEPTVLALLEDGQDSGLVEFISSIATGAATTAHTAMVGGTTLYVGGETALGDGTGDDFTFTVAAGDIIGLRKQFQLLDGIGAQGDVLVTVNGVQLDGSTAFVGLELDASNDRSLIEWMGPHWKLIANSGTGITT